MDAAFIWKLSKLGRIGSNRMRFDDDFADRLNYQYTGVILFMFIGLIGIRQYVGKPIQCWIPQEFTRGWEEYAENYCWVANTYFTPLEDKLPLEPDRSKSMISYYQWAPIVLATQALLFYLPCLTWRICMGHSGFNVHRILQMAADANELMPDVTWKTVQMMARYLETCIQRQRAYRRKLALQAQAKANAAHLHNNQADVQLINGKYQSSFEDTSANENKPKKMLSTVNQSSLSDGNNGTLRAKKGVAPPPPVNGNLNSQSSMDNQKMTDNSSFTNQSFQGYSDVPQQNGNHGSNQNKINHSLNNNKIVQHSYPRESMCKRICIKLCCLEGAYDKSDKNQNHNTTEKDRNIDKLAEKNYRTKGDVAPGFGVGRSYGNFLLSLYLMVKMAYLMNAITQIYLMESFIGANTTFYGFSILKDLLNNKHWNASGHFPRVTFCSLQTKKLGANDHYELQCVLPLNLFLEKIYIFLWFWHVALVVINVFSIVVWLKRMLWANSRLKFIRKYLKMMNALNDPKSPVEKVVVRAFVDHYLCADGVFLLRLISTNCGELLAGDLASELWLSFNRINNNSQGNSANPGQISYAPSLIKGPRGRHRFMDDGSMKQPIRQFSQHRPPSFNQQGVGVPSQIHSNYAQSQSILQTSIDLPQSQTPGLQMKKSKEDNNSDDIV